MNQPTDWFRVSLSVSLLCGAFLFWGLSARIAVLEKRLDLIDKTITNLAAFDKIQIELYEHARKEKPRP